jgi:cytochrome c oxidase subunit 2
MSVLADIGLFPDQASTVAQRVDHVYYFIIGTTVAISTAVAVLVIYFAIKYRRRGDEVPHQMVGSTVLETLWSVIPLVIALTMFFWSTSVYFDMTTPPADAEEVYVVGRQWMWKLQHPDGQREINELHVPVGRPVKLILSSEDVIHSFFIPDFRVKQDAVPGRYTWLWFQATKPGRYRIYCAEYCGTGHSTDMIGWVVAQEEPDYQQWLTERADLSLAQRGRQRFLQYQCVTCHAGTSDARAPNLEAIHGRRIQLADARTTVADDNYLRESILNPRAKVVAGFEPIMPTFQGIPEHDLLELVAFIKALQPGGTPSRNEESVAPQSDPKASEPKPFLKK